MKDLNNPTRKESREQDACARKERAGRSGSKRKREGEVASVCDQGGCGRAA